MSTVLNELCETLDEMSEVVLNSSSDDQILRNIYGWNHPPLSRQDLSIIPKNMAESIRNLEIKNIDVSLEETISQIPERLRSMYADTIPYMFNGNGIQAIPIYLSMLDWVKQVMSPLIRWETLQDTKAMPTALTRRLRGLQIDLDNLIPKKDNLSEQIDLIKEATEAAESLPTDLQSLKEARIKVSEIHDDSLFDRKKLLNIKPL